MPTTEAPSAPSLFASTLRTLPRPAGWEALRLEAQARLDHQDLPGRKEEAWRFLDLSPLKGLDPLPAPPAPAPADCRDCILPEARGSRLVFVNGRLDAEHSCTSALPPGVRLIPLARASEAAPELGRLLDPSACDVFASLNTVRFEDGALLFVPPNVAVEGAVHVLFLTQGGEEPLAVFPRLHVVLERGARLHLVEEYRGQGRYLASSVAEIHLHPGAALRHDRIQRESPEALHFAALALRQEGDSSYTGCTVSLGARLSRQMPLVQLLGEGTRLDLQGLALLDGDRSADTHSLIDHAAPRCESRQLHKCIADGASHAIFNGQIRVAKGAQQTDARQASRNLLLSEKARVDAKPQLEIAADDVKCSHGATVGQLDPEEAFYLQSRGLDAATARKLLTYAFAADILAAIPAPSLRRQLRHAVMAVTHAEELENLA